jgi:hypothetical protein
MKPGVLSLLRLAVFHAERGGFVPGQRVTPLHRLVRLVG